MSTPPAQADTQDAEIVVAGHVCLDVIPQLEGNAIPAPGQLLEVGQATVATGGCVSNTGLALHRIGIATRLIGCVGDDAFGREVARVYEDEGAGLADRLQVVPGEATSYSIVLNLAGEDRRFLHCPGVNRTFDPACITDASLQGARLLHFGYPPLMKRVCVDAGRDLADMFGRAHRLGLITSLDMAGVDTSGWAGDIDWAELLACVLPRVGLFLPSWDELMVMLDLPADTEATPKRLAETALRLLDLGCGVVGLKLGEAGLYVQSSSDAQVIYRAGLGAEWVGRELWVPAFRAQVRGTTGAGDTTIAGLLAGVVRQRTPEQTMRLANAVGAYCVGQEDALSGIPSLVELDQFLATHPKPNPRGATPPADWLRDDSGVDHGPHDRLTPAGASPHEA